MNNAKWTVFAVAYQLAWGYVLVLIVYQLGSFFGGSGFNTGTVASIAALVLLVWFLVRKPGKTTLPLTEGIRSAA